MLMKQNVNNDVTKDSPIPALRELQKNRMNTASRCILFSNAAGAPVCFHAESTVANLDPCKGRIQTALLRMPVGFLR